MKPRGSVLLGFLLGGTRSREVTLRLRSTGLDTCLLSCGVADPELDMLEIPLSDICFLYAGGRALPPAAGDAVSASGNC